MKKIIVGAMAVGVLCMGIADVGLAFWGQKKEAPAPAEKPQPAAPVVIPAKPAPAPEQPAVKVKPAPVKAETPAAPAQPVVVAPPPVSDAAKEKMKDMQRQQRTKLNNSQWSVDIMLMSGGGKPTLDLLVFKDNQFYAEKYAAQGFKASNYTLTMQDDGMTVWETMQSAEKGGTVFWRGEINDAQTEMRGVISIQKVDGSSEDFSFLSKNRQAYQEKKSSPETMKESSKDAPKEAAKVKLK